MNAKLLFLLIPTLIFPYSYEPTEAWIRINQLGYPREGIKVAVWCSKNDASLETFSLVDANNGHVVFEGKTGKPFGIYGPFSQTYRLDFSAYTNSGKYFLQ